MAIADHGSLVVETLITFHLIGDSGDRFYGVSIGVEDGDIFTAHDQDFVVGNWTENMVIGTVVVLETEDLPGGLTIDQTRATRYFNAVPCIFSTTNIELVSKDATGMLTSFSVEILALAPFIPVYAVD